MIIGWLCKYGIDFNEIFISQLGPEETAELRKDLGGVALRGPIIRTNERIWCYLEISQRPRVVCEEVLCLLRSG
jgi:hypothetical protein